MSRYAFVAPLTLVGLFIALTVLVEMPELRAKHLSQADAIQMQLTVAVGMLLSLQGFLFRK